MTVSVEKSSKVSDVLSDDIVSIKDRVSTLERTLRQREQGIEQAWRELERAQAYLDALNASSERINEELAISKDSIFRLAYERQRSQVDLPGTQIDSINLEEQLAQQGTKLDRLKLEVMDLPDFYTKLNSNPIASPNKLQAVRHVLQELKSGNDAARTELQRRINELGILARSSAESAKELAEARSCLRSVEIERDTARAELQDLIKKMETMSCAGSSDTIEKSTSL